MSNKKLMGYVLIIIDKYVCVTNARHVSFAIRLMYIIINDSVSPFVRILTKRERKRRRNNED